MSDAIISLVAAVMAMTADGLIIVALLLMASKALGSKQPGDDVTNGGPKP